MINNQVEEGQKNSNIYGGWNAAGHFSVQLVKRIESISVAMTSGDLNNWVISLDTFQVITHPFVDEDKSNTNCDALAKLSNKLQAVNSNSKVEAATMRTLRKELSKITKDSLSAAAHLIWSKKDESQIAEEDFVSD